MSKLRLRFEIIRLELQHTWGIARGAAAFKENVLAFYERDGLTGIGEAGHLTAAGQTAEQTLAGLEALRSLYEQADPFAFRTLPEQAVKVREATSPARAALEMALLDWLGQTLGVPLHRLFGLDPNHAPPTSFSIGLDTPEVMQQEAREAKNYAVLKVKLGGDRDEEIITALRAVTRQPIRVDANEGWRDKETALRKIKWLEGQGVELVEQPMPRAMNEETRWLKEHTRLPIIADEAAHTARDIPYLAGVYAGVNVKLMKAGGLIEALRMMEAARAHGLEVMLGCMIETSVGITAATHLQSLARWVDLDGCLLLKTDPYAGASLADGRWRLSSSPGLGVQRRGQVSCARIVGGLQKH